MNDDTGSGAQPWIITNKNHLTSLKNFAEASKMKEYKIFSITKHSGPHKGTCNDERN
jgi:hypothetical protein